MKITKILNYIVALFFIVSCDGWLNIVPDNVATIDNAFTLRTNAEKYLFTCYSYIPGWHYTRNPAIDGGDEVTYNADVRRIITGSQGGWYIQNGEQSASAPYCDHWTGTRGVPGLFRGIRECNEFIENIHRVQDMDDTEKRRWTDEVRFLKAYYHFYLVRMYGPIPLMDKNLGVDSSIEEVHVYRNTLDECFDYIVSLLDDIIESDRLPHRIEAEASELGRVTLGIVKAFKAQVLVYAASPLFCGNTEYSGVTDNRGVEIFCPVKSEEQKKKRWEDAAEACREAIEFLSKEENGGYSLYRYTSDEYKISPETRYCLTLRNKYSEPWNREIIWAYTDTWIAGVQAMSIPLNSLAYSTSYQGSFGVPLKITELFYTKNGVPIDEDKTWDYAGRYNLRKGTLEERLLMQPNYITVASQFDREYRFYADLAFDGAAWFGNGHTSENEMIYVNSKNGQPSCNTSGPKSNLTGVCPRKYVNYKTTMSSSSVVYIRYPFPLMTMSNLYLYYAECLNECGRGDEAIQWLDKIRDRAGLAGIKESWDNYSTIPNKYKTKEGLREIVHRERSIEMLFESERYWDLRRWKEAMVEYNKPLTGWNRPGSTPEDYYRETLVLTPRFEAKDYFSPIKDSEIYANPNIIQNPGW